MLALGLLATLPLGVVLGSLFPSVRSATMLMFGNLALIGISGIFYPITQLPAWLQWLGQVFPVYRLGLGLRSALLPGNLAAVEIGHSWRHLTTAGVLVAWAIAGLVLARILLRRIGTPPGRIERGRPARPVHGPGQMTVGDEKGQGVSEVVYNRIAMLRVERGVSRRQLAEALGVHYQTIGDLERGEYSPSLYLALRIAEHFEIPVEVIFSTSPFPRLGTAEDSASA